MEVFGGDKIHMVGAPSESFIFEWIQENVKIRWIYGAENLVGIHYGHFFTSVAFNETSPFSAFFLSSIKTFKSGSQECARMNDTVWCFYYAIMQIRL